MGERMFGVKKYNIKAIVVALLVLLTGFALTIADIYWIKSSSHVWISIGCSLVASALVILLNTFLVDVTKYNPLDDWKLKTITSTRAEINSDCEIEMEHAKHRVDIVAFGLRSFRTTHSEQKILSQLRKGINYRILTMNPESTFIPAREYEENNKNIKDSINDLIEWADNLNSKSSRGKIIIKGYSSMTLDFYWRVDNVVYIGPYWNGYESQQTITYKYIKGGKGFKTYTEYFQKLWNNSKNTVILTKTKEFKKQ